VKVVELDENWRLLTTHTLADAITNHSHSILIAFEHGDKEGEASDHPAICYVKADSTDEIRWSAPFSFA